MTKQLSDGFKKIIPAKVINKGTNICKLHSTSFQGVRRLFVLAYVIAENVANDEAGIKNNRNYFLLRGKIENSDVLIDGRNFYDQPIIDSVKQYEEVRKVSTGQDDYITGCLLDYAQFKDNFKLIAVNLNKL